jgi:hypothetical protein
MWRITCWCRVRSADFELVELSSVCVQTMVAVRTHSALATAKSFCRPFQSTRAVLHVIGSCFVVIPFPNFGVDERVALHS